MTEPAAPEPGSRRRDWFIVVLEAALLGVAALLAGLLPALPARWGAVVAYPYQIDVTEGYLLEQAAALARGESIYRPVDETPFLVGNYPPLMPWVYGMLNGARADSRSLPLGRWLVVAATVATTLLIGWIVWRRGGRIGPAVAAGLVFIVSYEVHQWSALVRVDLPALALTLAGLALFVSSPRRWPTVASGLLFVAAVYTRQTMLAAPAACAVSCLLFDRRRLAWLAGPALAVGVAALVALQAGTDGEFLRHIVTYNANTMDWAAWRMLMRNEIWFFHRWIIVAAGVAAIAAGVRWWRERPRTAGVEESGEDRTAGWAVAIYTVLAMQSLVAYAKVGAAPNYVLEPLAAGAIWVGAATAQLMNGGGRGRLLARGAALAVAAVLALHGAHLWNLRPIVFSSPTPTPEDRRLAGEVARAARQTAGGVMSEEPIFTMLAGKQVLFDPFIMTQLAREGKWDERRVSAMLERGEFELLIVNEDLATPRETYDRYTAGMAESVRDHYRMEGAVVQKGMGKVYYFWRYGNEID